MNKSSMQTGYNTDIEHNDTTYHIQTEDKGVNNPIIETLVYVGGQILDSKRTEYSDISGDGDSAEKIQKLMESQHQKLIEKVKSDFYNLEEEEQEEPEEEEPTEEISSQTAKEASESVPGEKEEGFDEGTLDEVILDYLEKESENARLELSLEGDRNLISGNTENVVVKASNSITGTPMKGVEIIIKTISTTRPPVVLAKGQTNEKGKLPVTLSIPEIKQGNAAIIFRGESDLGIDEIKRLIKRRV